MGGGSARCWRCFGCQGLDESNRPFLRPSDQTRDHIIRSPNEAGSVSLFSRLIDANLFVIQIPGGGNADAILATLHPFDLDGNGYEARVYRFFPERVVLSPAAMALGASGWGIEDVSVDLDGGLRLSRDEELSLKIWATLPCELSVKRVFLATHPLLPDDGPPGELLTLLNSEKPGWEMTLVTACPFTYGAERNAAGRR